MAPIQALPVFSANCAMTGHLPYQLALERGFANLRNGIHFDSVHLPQANRSDLLGRLVDRLLTWRL